MLRALIVTLLVGLAHGVNYRLPLEVKPLKYHLEIQPNFENDIFFGNVSIEVQATKHANTITLHQLGLKMPPKELIQVLSTTTNETIVVESVGAGECEFQHFFIITLATPLVIGNHYLLKIPNFEGSFISEYHNGFYYAHYVDELGTKKTFATTHFQPVFARRSFPCFDEPALKANFNLVVKRPSSSYISVANTPRDERLSNGLTDVFEETVSMSTYLLAFIVTDMQYSETFGRHRVLAPKFELEQGRHRYSLNSSYYLLNEMEKYTEIPYVFKKLDHASIPKDYSSGLAMENWGLITYRDDVLLTSSNADISQKRQALSTVAHEIQHQWIGNLVTPDWWSYIWLNEGFANYFENYLADKIEPGMDIWKRFIILTGQTTMLFDSIPEYTRPMTVTVEESYKIPFLFDKTAYQKSGAVIRMLENMVSRKVFRQGLIYYLKEKQFQTVTPRDLYRNIQRVLDESSENVFPQPLTVESVMTTWETIAGFPLVTVTRNYGSTINNINLKQRAFNIYNNQGEDGRWTIPINYASKGSASFESTAPKKWLIHPTDTFTVADLDDRDWFIVNVQQSGYYRVNYDERNWALIADALKEDHRVIHPLNRAKLLEDSFYLGATGDISPNIFSKLSEYLVNEDDSLVLAALPALFASMDNKLYYSRGHDDFKDRVIYLLQGAYNHLTFDERLSDRLSEKEARAGVIFWLCKMGHMECRSKALEKFEAWKNENATISTDLESAVFCSAMRSNNQSHFDYLFKLFIETTDYDLKSRIASGLSCMEEHKYLQRFLENCLNYCPSALLEQVIKQMHSSSKHGLEVVLDFLSQNMEKVHKIFGGHTKFMVEELASQSYTDGHLRKLARSQLWAKSVPFFDRAVATIANNVAWLNKNEHKLLEFLTHSQ